MTERELSQARSLQEELDALRRVAAEESGPEVLRAIGRQAMAVELARLEVMAFIATIPDPRIRAIAVMRFLEGKSWETIARRMPVKHQISAMSLTTFVTIDRASTQNICTRLPKAKILKIGALTEITKAQG